MREQPDSAETVKLVQKRYEYLQTLKQSPRSKSALARDLDVSRTTVHRAIDTLEEAGLVKDDGAECKLAPGTEELLAAFTATVEMASLTNEYADLFHELPDDHDIPRELFTDGEVTLAKGPSPIPVHSENLIDRIEKADSVWMLSVRESFQSATEALVRKAADPEQTLTIGFSDEMFEELTYRFGVDGMQSFAQTEGTTGYRMDNLDFGILLVGEVPDAFVIVTLYSEWGHPIGRIRSNSLQSQAWGRHYIDHELADVEPVSVEALAEE